MKKSGKYANKKQRVQTYWTFLTPHERIGKIQALCISDIYNRPMDEIKEKVYDNEPMHQQID